MRTWAIAALAVPIAALPVAFAVRFARSFALEMPLGDDWLLIDFYGRLATGEVGLADVFAPHGSHVPVFARFVLSVVAYATDLDLHAVIYASFSLAVFTAWMIHRISVHTSPAAEPMGRAAAACFTIALLFAPAQYPLWTWSVLFFHVFENALVVGAVLVLTRPRPIPALAVILCTMASFNRLEGLLTWGVLAPLYLSATTRARPGRTRLVPWATWGIGVWAAVLGCTWGLAPAGGAGDPLGTSDSEWSAKLLFIPGLLGAPPGYLLKQVFRAAVPTHAFVPAGLLVLAVLVASGVSRLRRGADRAATLPWVSLGAFATAFAGATGIARIEGRWDIATMSKFQIQVFDAYVAAYSITASLAGVAAVHLSHHYFASRARVLGFPSRRVGVLAAVSGAIVVVANYLSAWPEMEERRRDAASDTHCVELARYLAFPNACLMPEGGAAALQKAGLRTIHDDVRFVENRREPGGVALIKTPKERGGFPDRTVILGSTIRTHDGGNVFLTSGERRRFFARAARWSVIRDRTMWVAVVPSEWLAGETLVAWHYDPTTRTFTRLREEKAAR